MISRAWKQTQDRSKSDLSADTELNCSVNFLRSLFPQQSQPVGCTVTDLAPVLGWVTQHKWPSFPRNAEGVCCKHVSIVQNINQAQKSPSFSQTNQREIQIPSLSSPHRGKNWVKQGQRARNDLLSPSQCNLFLCAIFIQPQTFEILCLGHELSHFSAQRISNYQPYRVSLMTLWKICFVK